MKALLALCKRAYSLALEARRTILRGQKKIGIGVRSEAGTIEFRDLSPRAQQVFRQLVAARSANEPGQI